MIVLSKKTLDLIQAESAKPNVQSAVADETLSAGHFSTELQSSLAEDAKVDGTGATMIPQIISIVAQLMGIGLDRQPHPAPAVPPTRTPVSSNPK